MTIATEDSADIFLNIVAGVPLNNAYPLFAEDEVVVIYGSQALEAVYPTDYTVELSDPDFDQFTITPTASLVAKINALIATPPTDDAETNFVVVRRKLDYLTSVQPETVRNTPFLSKEIDRIHMKLIQIAERVSRTISLPATIIGDLITEYTISAPVEGFAPVWRGNKLVAEIDATNIAAAEGYASDAEAALAATVIAKDAAEDAQAAAEVAAASIPLHNKTAVVAPTVNDDSGDGYSVLSRWVNTAAVPDPEVYVCINASVGAAVWVLDTLGIDDLGTAAVLNSVDEDDMVSNSPSLLPSQQSVKAYVDTKFAAVPTSGQAKAWAYVTYSAGVPTLAASYGVASITDLGVGYLRITFTTAFASVNYCVNVSTDDNAAVMLPQVDSRTTTYVDVYNRQYSTGNPADPDAMNVSCFGT